MTAHSRRLGRRKDPVVKERRCACLSDRLSDDRRGNPAHRVDGRARRGHDLLQPAGLRVHRESGARRTTAGAGWRSCTQRMRAGPTGLGKTRRRRGARSRSSSGIRRFDGAFRWHCVRALPPARCQWGAHDLDRYRHRHRRPAALELSLRASEQDAIEPSPSYNRSSRLLPGGSASSTGTFASVASTRARSGGRHLGRRAPGAHRGRAGAPLWSQIENAYQRALSGTAVVNLEVSGPSAEQPDGPFIG